MKEELGKYFLDLSKLVFGGVLLAGIMNQDISPWILFSSGGITVLIFAILGLIVLRYKK